MLVGGGPEVGPNAADTEPVKRPARKRSSPVNEPTRSTWNEVSPSDHRLLMAGWLAGYMAHEVNNHLAAALMELELALGQSHSSTTNELLARLHVAVESAGEVCRSTLGLLRPASETGVPGLVGEAIDRTLACLGRLRDRVVIEVPEECRLVATPLSLARMQQVLLNSMLNAVQASGGKVFVTARMIDASHQPSSTWNSRTTTGRTQSGLVTSVELVIEDDGPGMPADVRARIDSGSTLPPVGVESGGFGLTILQRLAVDAGGAVRVESATPQGTRLVISLPSVEAVRAKAA